MQSIKNKIVKEKLGIESEICKLGEGGGGEGRGVKQGLCEGLVKYILDEDRLLRKVWGLFGGFW